MTTARHIPQQILGIIVCLIAILGGPAQANWSEALTNGKFNLSTWRFESYPAVVGTFRHTIATGADGNSYLVLTETTPPDIGGAGFGMGLASDEQFADVRVGAVVNASGDAAHSYYGLGARINYFVDDGMITGLPGIVASGYVMLVHWEDGPENLRIEVRKFVHLNQEIMNTITEVLAPGLDHDRTYYAELDVVGTNPAYITGALYAGRGGPVVVRTPTLIDTDGVDSWENPGVNDAPYASGVSIVFGANQELFHPGFYCTLDDISSTSDGPAAAARYPRDGETDVPTNGVLSWCEAAFATGREVWFGPQGAMQKVEGEITGTSYTPDPLEPGRSYQWRVNEIGPTGHVDGPTLTFTTGDCFLIDDFESYADDTQIAAAWVHNITGFDYVFRETATADQGTQSMRLSYQNQYDPFFTEATRTFDAPQDWTAHGAEQLSVAFRGSMDNVEQRLYVRVQDDAGNAHTIAQPFNYAVRTRFWRQWDIALSELSQAGVNLTAVAKLTIGVGDGTKSAQPNDDIDSFYLDNIRLCPR